MLGIGQNFGFDHGIVVIGDVIVQQNIGGDVTYCQKLEN